MYFTRDKKRMCDSQSPRGKLSGPRSQNSFQEALTYRERDGARGHILGPVGCRYRAAPGVGHKQSTTVLSGTSPPPRHGPANHGARLLVPPHRHEITQPSHRHTVIRHTVTQRASHR